jgi:hypothetical protein
MPIRPERPAVIELPKFAISLSQPLLPLEMP